MIQPMKPSSNLEQFKKKNKTAYWSKKLDGVRVLCHITKFIVHDSFSYEISWYSGNGKELHNFHHMDEAISHYVQMLDYTEILLDGEMVAENFSKVMTQLRRLKDIDPSIFEYHVFDIANRNDVTLRERLELLDRCCDNAPVFTLPHHIAQLETLDKLAQGMTAGEHGTLEGFVFKNPDSFYENKRSNEWVKVKRQETLDCEVVNAIEGNGKHIGRLGALVCKLADHTFKVGTGFTDQERRDIWNAWQQSLETPSCTAAPAIIEVKFMEITSHGIPRHPVFVRIREDK